jgi:adenylate cyclase
VTDPIHRSKLGLHIAQIAYSLILIFWYVLPFFDKELGAFDPRLIAGELYGTPPAQAVASVIVTVLAYLVPVICLWKIASVFLVRALPSLADPERPLPILFNVVSSGIAVAFVLLDLVRKATSVQFFAAFAPVTYAVAAVSIAFNAYFLVMLIVWLSRRQDAYQEYEEFRRLDDERPKGALSVISRRGIQRRLLITFISLIAVIIIVLSFILLQDFRRTITNAVNANGEGLAERTASVVKANPGDTDRISLDDYFDAEAKKNQAARGQSSFLFNTLSFFRRDSKADNFVVWASTDRHVIGTRAPRMPAALSETKMDYNPATKATEFRAPVILSNVFIGYVMVDYANEVIYEPFFRTTVKVIVIAALFIYASIFLIYLFGRAIVFPILFLRMSVNGIASILADMIEGKLKVSAGLLQYKDRVNTRDEIKLLSNEVNRMTTVIRNVIPYISESTLKHAEKDKPTSEKRIQTFLFTDIRGFTTMSESLPPEKTVEILNHFLNLQYAIIQANGGDVDKFVGDEVMATFEGSRKEINACKAAIEIRRAMAQERELAEAEERKVVSIGIGINTGEVVFGSMGAKDRMDFTSIGDPVNLAARLEGTNKEYGTKTLLTETVYEKVKDAFLCREIDLMTVKGKTEPVRIFELLQETKSASEKLGHMKKQFETSLEWYRRQKWDSAEKGFASLVKDFKDETSQVFLGRVAEFRKAPPGKNWDFVFHRETK